MFVALFESEPQASAAGINLKELGFDSSVTVREDNTFDERIRDFITGKAAPFEPRALLTSDDADAERFARIVQRHYGILVGA